MRAAYASGSVVVTPNPHVHFLFADKRTLTLLSDSERLEYWGLSTAHLDALRSAAPATVVVTPFNADSLWRDRRNLFFRPARGHGSKAAYRGDKLTRRVWSEILAGGYVAQTYAEPSVRIVERDGMPAALKVDIRLYTYAGTVILAAARLYQGQTTRVRTHYSHQMTAAASAIAAMKFLMFRSKRVAMRLQSLMRQKRRSTTLRCL